MTKRRRRLYCIAVQLAVLAALVYAGAGWFACLVPLYGLLEWWDGMETAEEIWRS